MNFNQIHSQNQQKVEKLAEELEFKQQEIDNMKNALSDLNTREQKNLNQMEKEAYSGQRFY